MSPQRTIAHYRITSSLSEGGMSADLSSGYVGHPVATHLAAASAPHLKWPLAVFLRSRCLETLPLDETQLVLYRYPTVRDSSGGHTMRLYRV
jgi:hypothetical protein